MITVQPNLYINKIYNEDEIDEINNTNKKKLKKIFNKLSKTYI